MILVYTETNNGQLKKSALELVSYAKALSSSEQVIAVAINCDDYSPLSLYGADTIIGIKNDDLLNFSAKAYAHILQQIALEYQVKTIVMSNSSDAKYIAPILAINWQAGYLSNVSTLLQEGKYKKNIFSSKAIACIEATSERKVISLSGNSFGLKENPVNSNIVSFTPNLPQELFSIKVEKKEKIEGKVSIADASIVISGGRGLQTSDNWHIIEELAEVLNAATACTKPVSDMGWRPHSEHVGQTGKPVTCDLYIAIGISGAIQHLAGVISSKVKVVINSDPEAPFFKVADYGIVGNALEIVPKLTEKLRQLK